MVNALFLRRCMQRLRTILQQLNCLVVCFLSLLKRDCIRLDDNWNTDDTDVTDEHR